MKRRGVIKTAALLDLMRVITGSEGRQGQPYAGSIKSLSRTISSTSALHQMEEWAPSVMEGLEDQPCSVHFILEGLHRSGVFFIITLQATCDMTDVLLRRGLVESLSVFPAKIGFRRSIYGNVTQGHLLPPCLFSFN
ncbi:hypothetical protein AOLI_G00027090 [Acnodon oligacanthus]